MAEAIEVKAGKGRGDDWQGVKMPVQKPTSPEEWEEFWAQHTEDPTRDVNELAFQKYRIVVQDDFRRDDENGLGRYIREDGSLDAGNAAKAFRKAWDGYQYTSVRKRKASKPKQVKVDEADLSDSEKLQEALAAQGIDLQIG